MAYLQIATLLGRPLHVKRILINILFVSTFFKKILPIMMSAISSRQMLTSTNRAFSVFRMLNTSMLNIIGYLKILNSIVKLNSIKMMNYLCRKQISSKVLLQNKPMFINISIPFNVGMVEFSYKNIASIILHSAAFIKAISSTRIIAMETFARAKFIFTRIFTLETNHSLIIKYQGGVSQ